MSHADMQKDTIFTPTSLVPKLFYPKKCVNYDNILFSTKLRKRPKRPNKCKKGQKVNLRLQNVQKNAT